MPRCLAVPMVIGEYHNMRVSGRRRRHREDPQLMFVWVTITIRQKTGNDSACLMNYNVLFDKKQKQFLPKLEESHALLCKQFILDSFYFSCFQNRHVANGDLCAVMLL